MIKVASLQSFSEIWQRTSLVQRVLLVGIGLGCAGAAALLVGWVGQPKYALLYGGLAPEEAAKIVEKVEDAGVACKTTDGGASVYVDSGKVRELRMKLAAENLPAGGHAGYKILDAQRIGTSPYQQKINHVRAVEGELAMTLEVLDAVVKARVKVAPARDSVFASKDKKPASASVMLRLKSGALLTAGNIAAIMNLVAGGIEGLNAANVTVVDAEGNLLSPEGGDGPSSQMRTVLDQKLQMEDRLARRIEKHLGMVLGPGRATVRVSATIDATSNTETTTTPNTELMMKRSSETSKPVPGTGAGGKPGGLKETVSETDYFDPIITTTKEVVTPPGSITALSVSCFVDLSPPKAKEGEPAPAGHKLTEDNVKEAIRASLGIDAAKLESLVVVDTPFYRDPALATEGLADEDEGIFTPAFMLEMARRVSLGLLVIGVLVGLKIARRKPKASAVAPAIEGQMPAGERLLAAAQSGDPEVLRGQITQALQDNPDEVKRLFLSWVQSEQGGT